MRMFLVYGTTARISSMSRGSVLWIHMMKSWNCYLWTDLK